MSWLGDWTKRIELTIDNTNVDSDLSNFPVLVYISAASGIGDVDASCVFDELGSDANRKKIAVTTSDGTTQCYVEIERWDDANEKAWLWVKVLSVIAASTTTLYLYYDSTKAENTTYVGDTGDSPAQNVWDSNFKGIWHMAQDPNGDVADAIKDSTSNANHGTPAGSMTTADLVDSKIGKAIDFDGTNDYITIPQLFVSPTKVTWELVFKSDISNTTEIRTFVYNNDDIFIINSINSGTADLIKTYSYGTTGGGWSSSTSAYSVLDWRYIVGTVKADDYLNLFVDGTQIGSQVAIGTLQDLGDEFRRAIGTARNLIRFADGIIDEVRISDIDRSAAWIKATYHSNWDNINLFGSEENYSEVDDITFSNEALVNLGLVINSDTGIFIGQSVFKQDPWVLNTLHYGKDNADKVGIGDRSGNGIWGFVKQEDRPSYNEGDEIETSASPEFDIDFTGVPITPIHKPCGYWHSTPANMISGDPPSIYADKCDDSRMAWDYDTSAETIGRNDSVLIAITDDGISGSPYIWELDAQSIENGFSLGNRKTLGLTNSLHSDSGACGSCLIMVTGCDGLGTMVSAYVRCTWGEWGDYIVICTESEGHASGCMISFICEGVDSTDKHRYNYSCLGCVCNDCPCEGTQVCDLSPDWTHYWPPCDPSDSGECGPAPYRCPDLGVIGVSLSRYRLWGC